VRVAGVVVMPAGVLGLLSQLAPGAERAGPAGSPDPVTARCSRCPPARWSAAPASTWPSNERGAAAKGAGWRLVLAAVRTWRGQRPGQ